MDEFILSVYDFIEKKFLASQFSSLRLKHNFEAEEKQTFDLNYSSIVAADSLISVDRIFTSYQFVQFLYTVSRE